MRNYIIVAIIVLCISTLTGGYSDQPGYIVTGINEVTFRPISTKPRGGMVANFMVADGYRPYKGPTDIVDKEFGSDAIDFPQVGRFK